MIIRLYRDDENKFALRVEYPDGSYRDIGVHELMIGDTFTIVLEAKISTISFVQPNQPDTFASSRKRARSRR